jgi:hypothetical protein
LYEIRPEPAKAFAEDASITLPRFQRRVTWKPKQRFELTLSLFKGYPLGMVVVKKEMSESDPGLVTSKSLLDGRQRRTTLAEMLNPEHIHAWASKSLPLRAADDLTDVSNKFWEYIDNWLGTEEGNPSVEGDSASEAGEGVDTSDPVDGAQPEVPAEDDGSSGADTDASTAPEATPATTDEAGLSGVAVRAQTSIRDSEGLKALLKLLRLVHPKRGHRSAFTNPFDFSAHVPTLEYLATVTRTGGKRVDADLLISWILWRKGVAERQRKEFPPTPEEFYEWLTERGAPDAGEAPLRTEIDRNWGEISERLIALDALHARVQDAKISLLEITGSSANDEMKIFYLINEGGTPLSAAEILSATAVWNKDVPDAAPEISASKMVLYEELAIDQPEGVVRWDVAASFMDRIDVPVIFRKFTRKESLERKMTIGFQLLSGYYQHRIMKDDIHALGALDSVSWGTTTLETTIKEMAAELRQNTVLKYWDTWNTSLMDATTVAIALNYLLMLVKDWERKNAPARGSTTWKQFQKNAVILLDRLLYEQVTGQWRGSSDSRIGENLDRLDGSPDVLAEVPQASWQTVIKEAVDGEEINGRRLQLDGIDPRIKVILRYYYVLKGKSGPSGPTVTVDWDHIIPRDLLAQSTNPEAKRLTHSLGNLALMPSSENRSKKDRRLTEVQVDTWLVEQITKYEEVPVDRYAEFSTAEGVMGLRDLRGDLVKAAFDDGRPYLMSHLQPSTPS